MINPPISQRQEVKRFEDTTAEAINEAIDAIIVQYAILADAEWVGKVVKFQRRWHAIDDVITVEAPISSVAVNFDDGIVRIMWFVKVRNPHTGHTDTLSLYPDNCILVG